MSTSSAGSHGVGAAAAGTSTERGTKKQSRHHAPGGVTLGKDNSRAAQRLAAAILEVLAGGRTPGQAAEALGVSLPRYYYLEGRALRGLLASCEAKPPGRIRSPQKELTTLQRQYERLQRELSRQQTLVRMAQRTLGLPIAEAMACGLPVIVAGYGAALDFCNEENAFLIPARVVRFAEKRVGAMETVDYPWLAEPDAEALADLLRRVVAHPEEARSRAEAGRRQIVEHFTWEQSVAAVEERLRILRAAAATPVGTAAYQPDALARGGGVFLAGASGWCRELNEPTRGEVSLASASGWYRGRNGAKVSLCMIVRNEEHNLPACLQSARGLFDEIVIVDTGSTDRTKEIAGELGARVFDFPWVDNFAVARNESNRHATGDWIFWLDADDRLDGTNRFRLAGLFRALAPARSPEGASDSPETDPLARQEAKVLEVRKGVRTLLRAAEISCCWGNC
jgi:hypothetical protein